MSDISRSRCADRNTSSKVRCSVLRWSLIMKTLGAFMLLAFSVPSGGFLVATSLRSRLSMGRTRTRASPTMLYDVRYSPNKWRGEEIEPGFGGVWPGDPNAKTFHVKYVNKQGETMAAMDVPVDRYVYFAFEDAGIEVPIINRARMCRNGCCTTCAVRVKEGKVKQENALGLLKDLKREGYALTCCSYPRSDLTIELQDEDEVYRRQWGDSFEGGGVEWGGVFMDED